jgi:glycosyltransferase involved in cell wall biosynthesis
MFQGLEHKCITTLHGRLDLPEYHPIYAAFPDMPLVSISDSQRSPVQTRVNWVETIHHGLPHSVCPFSPCGGEYLAFLGRIAPEKRVDRAINIAVAAERPLKIAAKVDAVNQAYFSEVIRPLLDHPLVEFIGEIGEAQKAEFLGNALALLFPIDWPEPFGLVMIEAMSTGTPVVAWLNGSVPEVVEHGRSGWIVDSMQAAVEAVRQARTLPRTRVRSCFERRFTSKRMASSYAAAYQAVLNPQRPRTAPRPFVEERAGRSRAQVLQAKQQDLSAAP